MKFKNDKQRIAFLEDYWNKSNGWYIWKDYADIQRRFWRYDLPDCALIVEEDQRTYEWPDTRVEWAVVHWYIIKDWTFKKKTFRDQVGSRSEALRIKMVAWMRIDYVEPYQPEEESGGLR